MTLQDAIDNLFIDLDSYQLIHLVTSRTKGTESVTYTIGMGNINSRIIFRIEADEFIAVQTYQLDSLEKAKRKLTWLINKYSLSIKSVVYMKNMQVNELIANCYKDNLLSYTYETEMINRKEMLISYSLKSTSIDYNQFLTDFNSIVEILEYSSKRFALSIVLHQQNPISLVRKMKLESIDI